MLHSLKNTLTFPHLHLSQSSKPKQKEIPTPNITLVPDYTKNVPPTYHVPTSFVRHVPKTATEVEETVEYNLDREDEDWWTDNLQFGPQAGWMEVADTNGGDGTGTDGDGAENAAASDGGADVNMEGAEGVGVGVGVAGDGSAASPVPSSTPPPAQLTNRQLRKGIYQMPLRKDKPKRVPPPAGQPTPPTLPLRHLEHMLDILEKATGFDVIVSQGEAERLILGKIPELNRIFAPRKPSPRRSPQPSPRAGAMVSSADAATSSIPAITVREVISEAYRYWINKRSKLRKPLLRKYWPVTSANDTNPHLVFRPREKEKYKLRKKRVNDMETYRKMRRLREDFARLRNVVDLVVRREKLALLGVKMGCELTDQRIYDAVDTSGLPRRSNRHGLGVASISEALDIPRFFSTTPSGAGGASAAAAAAKAARGRKRKRGPGIDTSVLGPGSALATEQTVGESAAPSAVGLSSSSRPAPAKSVVAGEDDGFGPVPTFLQPLNTREKAITSWNKKQDNASAHPVYTDSHPESHRQHTAAMRYTRRPRVARGGRIVYDRIPMSAATTTSSADNSVREEATVYIAGQASASTHAANATPLFRLLPKPLDHEMVSRRIEHVCVEAINDDVDDQNTGKRASVLGVDSEEEVEKNDGDAILVKLEDWICTDDQLWGEERGATGPL